MRKQKSLALALGAGGAMGACHIGFLQVLKENNVEVDYISGCSMGAVIGGAYASGADLDEIEKFARIVKQSAIIDFSLTPLHGKGLVKGDAAYKAISQFVKCKEACETIIPFNCVTVDLLSGKLLILSEGILMNNIYASMAIPTVFQPIRIDDALCVDGGTLCRIPIAAAKKFNSDVIIAVDAIGPPRKVDKIDNIFNLITRVYDIVDWERSMYFPDKADLTITPDNPDSNPFHARYICASIDAGRKAAIEALPQIKELLGIDY